MKRCSILTSGKLQALTFLVFTFILFFAGKESLLFRFPINTDEIKLAGTFGELRPGHFHAGIDIKTNGQAGVPVFAVGAGYVYRIKISPDHYGKALYLRHEDGKFSVYAHLSSFNDEIEEIVFQKQYASKTYDQDIYLPSNRLPVQTGDLVAFSGNTGNSAGPHLHFEIRDSDDRLTDPLQFFSTLIEDHVPPVITSVGIEPLDTGSFVGGKPVKQIIIPSGEKGNYKLNEIVYVSGKTGIEFSGYDLLDAAPNKCGINYSKLFLDGNLIYEFNFDHFKLEQRKFINLYFDHPHNFKHHELFQRCYIEDGNALDAFPVAKNRGAIELKDDLTHEFLLLLSDVFGNTTRLTGKMKRFIPWEISALPPVDRPYSSMDYFLNRDILQITIDNPYSGHLEGINLEFDDGSKKIIKPSCFSEGKLWFFYKISGDPLPDDAYDPISKTRMNFQFVKTIFPGKNNIAQSGDTEFFFPFGCVYDTLPLEVRRMPGSSNTYSQVYAIGDPSIPIHIPFIAKFQPERTGDLKNMVVAKMSSNNQWTFVGKTLRDDGTIMASLNEFGSYTLMADSSSPIIEPLNFSPGGFISPGQHTLEFKVKDNFSGIESERLLLRLDQEWILGEYDEKTDRLVHPIVKRPAGGYHTIEVNAWDGAGNLNTKIYRISF